MAHLACLHRGDVTSARLPSVALFDALYAFFQKHQYCGELDAGVEDDASG
jgi:hypothetical protein